MEGHGKGETREERRERRDERGETREERRERRDERGVTREENRAREEGGAASKGTVVRRIGDAPRCLVMYRR
jgi:hypothetical protein